MCLINDQIRSVIEDNKMNELCSALVSLDKAIIFCAIAQKSGYLVTLASNQNNKRLPVQNHDQRPVLASNASSKEEAYDLQQEHLSDAEIARYAFHTGIMCGLHRSWERKLGSIRHFISYYDEMPLVTIVFDDGHFLLMGIDSSKQHGIDRILSQKVLPLLQKGSGLAQK
jgi:hypothetical protein